MSVAIAVEHWSAWAPGLETQAAWTQWLADPLALPVVSEGAATQPPLAEMPAMMRRRIDPLGRIALQSAYAAQQDQPIDAAVFASRWGELERSEMLLGQLAANEPLSPTSFSLSVHNAIAALYSIARKDTGNFSAVSAGAYSTEAGFIEALGLIADGARRVLLVSYDAPATPLYRPYEAAGESCQFAHAFALLLTRAEHGGIRLQRGGEAPVDERLNPSLRTLRFLADASAATLTHGGWTWSRA
jgi:hypothetical protein